MPWRPLPGCFRLIDEENHDRGQRGRNGTARRKGQCGSGASLLLPTRLKKKLIEVLTCQYSPDRGVAHRGTYGCRDHHHQPADAFFDVDSGAIKVGGTDIRDVTRESLPPPRIATLLQDTWLKSGTIGTI